MKSSRPSNLAYTLYLEVPFQNDKQAATAVQVLKPDPILKPQDFHVEYTSSANNLCVSFEGVDDRVLRVGVSSVIESIKTIVETIDEFS